MRCAVTREAYLITKKIQVDSMDELVKLFGPFDENIKAICSAFDVKIVMQDGQSCIYGEETAVDQALAVVNKLRSFIADGDSVDIGRVNYLCDLAKSDKLGDVDELMGDVVAITSRGKPIKCKTVGQKKYVDLMKKNTITFGVGPAGTGKRIQIQAGGENNTHSSGSGSRRKTRFFARRSARKSQPLFASLVRRLARNVGRRQLLQDDGAGYDRDRAVGIHAR